MSVPIPPGIIRAATATAVPPLEPPGIIAGSQGFRAGPVIALLFVIPKASSCMFAFAPRSAPASRRAAATGAFRGATRPARAPVAPLVVRVVVSMLSFRARGTPASGGRSPELASTARAEAMSASQSWDTKALRPAIASHRATSASTYSRHEHARSRSAAAACATVRSVRSALRTRSSPVRHIGARLVEWHRPRTDCGSGDGGRGILISDDISPPTPPRSATGNEGAGSSIDRAARFECAGRSDRAAARTYTDLPGGTPGPRRPAA